MPILKLLRKICSTLFSQDTGHHFRKFARFRFSVTISSTMARSHHIMRVLTGQLYKNWKRHWHRQSGWATIGRASCFPWKLSRLFQVNNPDMFNTAVFIFLSTFLPWGLPLTKERSDIVRFNVNLLLVWTFFAAVGMGSYFDGYWIFRWLSVPW